MTLQFDDVNSAGGTERIRILILTASDGGGQSPRWLSTLRTS